MADMVAILDFQLEQIYLLLISKLSNYFLPSFVSTGLSFQEKKRKTDFQGGRTWDFMPVLLFYKPDKDPIKIEVSIVRTTFSLLIVCLWETEGQVTLM